MRAGATADSRRRLRAAGVSRICSRATNRILPRLRFGSTVLPPAMSSTRRARAPNPICTRGAMRIPCPFCGERDGAEFVYRGDASPVRPGARQARRRLSTMSTCAQPAGEISGALVSRAGMPELARGDARYAYTCRYPHATWQGERAMSRLPSGGLIDRGKPLSFVFDGESFRRLRGRHAGFGACRQ